MFASAWEVLFSCIDNDFQSVASALTLLMSETFTFIPSDSPDNDKLEALVSEYFTGNDEITDYEESDSDDGIVLSPTFVALLSFLR